MGNGKFAVSDGRSGKVRKGSSEDPKEEKEGGGAVRRKVYQGAVRAKALRLYLAWLAAGDLWGEGRREVREWGGADVDRVEKFGFSFQPFSERQGRGCGGCPAL